MLEVKQKQIDVLHKRGETRRTCIAGRFHGNVDALRPRGVRQLHGKIRLLEHLAAG